MRILVVDDNQDFCSNIGDVLEMEGHEPTLSFDGPSALELVKERAFDLVILDVVMPRMDGLETFRRLSRLAPRTPVVMVSGFSVENITGSAVQEGVVKVVKKPINFDEFFAMIRSIGENNASARDPGQK